MSSKLFFRPFWIGWNRIAAWVICVLIVGLLGGLRSATDAHFAFASLAFLPVLAIAWIEGTGAGIFVALLAAIMWMTSDMVSEPISILSWIPWANAVTRFMTYSLLAILAAQVYDKFEKEHDQATLDTLTGLGNRRAILEAGETEVARAKRYGRSMAVFFIDLDCFKQLNDAKGHDVGDAALRAAAYALQSSMRSTDFVARLGGDEFAILIPEIGFDAAVSAGKKCLSTLQAHLEAYPPPVKASLGIAWIDTFDLSFAEILCAADQLMYEVKAKGKNGFLARRIAPTA